MLSETFYERFLRPRLFGMSSDPEDAHQWMLHQLGKLQRHPWLRSGVRAIMGMAYPELQQTIWGLNFPNPVGLPGGMDKNGQVPAVWPALGFGFEELGTITARPQYGNPRPRIFRLEEDQALINRMGFNSDGAEAVAKRLAVHQAKGNLPVEPIFINIGKSKVVPLDSAIDDYLSSLKKLFKYASVIVGNVSSPNTPDLRKLQDGGRLRELLTALIVHNKLLAREHGVKPKPILVKIAPDLSWGAIDDILQICSDLDIAGLIATNTTITRPPLKNPIQEEGGFSGRQFFEKSAAIVKFVRQKVDEDFIIIGVGGIWDPEEAWQMLLAGANLIQVYTAFVYQGPALIKKINMGLRECLRDYGFTHISQVKQL